MLVFLENGSTDQTERSSERAKLTGKHRFVRYAAIFIMKVRSNQQSQEILAGSAFGPGRPLLDGDPLPLLDDLHSYLFHNGFSAVPSIINSKGLTPIRFSALHQEMMIPKAMGAHNGDDPWGDTADKRNDGRPSQRIVGLHYRVERTAEVIFSKLQRVEVVPELWRRKNTGPESGIQCNNPTQRVLKGQRKGEIERYLTCKSDDVQCGAIHTCKNIHRHTVG